MIMRSQRSWALPLVVLLGAFAVLNALLTPGCGVSSASSDSVQVWGRVTYGGKPVPGGVVIFKPEASQTNWGVGPIDEKGAFKISSYMASGQLQPGPYKIFITPPRVRPTQVGSNPKDRDAAAPVASPPETDKSRFGIPERFLRPQSSGLLVTLEKEGNRIDIDLKD